MSVGVEDWDCFRENTPDVISATGIYGARIQDYKTYFGFNAGFRLSNSSLAFHRWATVLKAGSFNSIVELNFNQNTKEVKNSSTGLVTKESHLSKNLNVYYDAVVNPEWRVGADVKLNLNNNNYDVAAVGEYKIDLGTTFRAKVSTDNTAVVSLNHNYRGLLNFGVVSKVNIILTKARLQTTR